MKWDGHTHSPYCPHGSSDSLRKYIEKAIAEGFTHYSITEHAPLPKNFTDPVPLQDSAMAWENLDSYLHECSQLKKEYAQDIQLLIGFEVDYLLGFEQEIASFLDEVGPYIDDSLLSVHFLKVDYSWACLDYSPELFEQDLIQKLGNVDLVYLLYYQTYLKAVTAELGQFKPKRMGHITLIEKFKKKYPSTNKDVWWEQIETILSEIKQRGYQLDYNTAGMLKPLCEDPYPSQDVLRLAKQLKIPFVYGSDSHQAKTVGHHYELFTKNCL